MCTGVLFYISPRASRFSPGVYRPLPCGGTDPAGALFRKDGNTLTMHDFRTAYAHCLECCLGLFAGTLCLVRHNCRCFHKTVFFKSPRHSGQGTFLCCWFASHNWSSVWNELSSSMFSEWPRCERSFPCSVIIPSQLFSHQSPCSKP